MLKELFSFLSVFVKTCGFRNLDIKHRITISIKRVTCMLKNLICLTHNQFSVLNAFNAYQLIG
jgi:hypothetical protein